MFDVLLEKAFILVFIISVIPLAAGSVAGLLVGVLQAATQIQEQIFSYLARLVVVTLCLVIARDFFSEELIGFFADSISSLEYVGSSP